MTSLSSEALLNLALVLIMGVASLLFRIWTRDQTNLQRLQEQRTGELERRLAAATGDFDRRITAVIDQTERRFDQANDHQSRLVAKVQALMDSRSAFTRDDLDHVAELVKQERYERQLLTDRINTALGALQNDVARQDERVQSFGKRVDEIWRRLFTGPIST